jgi:spermidine synthase
MRASRLKRLASHFWPIKVASYESTMSGHLLVELVEGRYRLRTGDAVYSFEDRYTSFATALNEVTFPVHGDILVLGMGMGSIPWLLQSVHKTDNPITCVDIDPLMPELVNRYYPDKGKLAQLELVVADVIDYLGHNEREFGLICVDVFVAEEVPHSMWELESLMKLRQSLSENGTILFSRLSTRQSEESELWENLTDVFPGNRDILTFGNAIMLWQKN